MNRASEALAPQDVRTSSMTNSKNLQSDAESAGTPASSLDLDLDGERLASSSSVAANRLELLDAIKSLTKRREELRLIDRQLADMIAKYLAQLADSDASQRQASGSVVDLSAKSAPSYNYKKSRWLAGHEQTSEQIRPARHWHSLDTYIDARLHERLHDGAGKRPACELADHHASKRFRPDPCARSQLIQYQPFDAMSSPIKFYNCNHPPELESTRSLSFPQFGDPNLGATGHMIRLGQQDSRAAAYLLSSRQQHFQQQQQQHDHQRVDAVINQLEPGAAQLLMPMVMQKMSYRCHVCGSGFEDRHRLQQHLSIHLNLHPSWFEEKTIKETMAQYELRRGDYLCTSCSLRFETTAEFDKHMQTHGEKPHQCALCTQDNKFVSFRYYRQLLTHLRSHCFLYSCKFNSECKQTANRKDYLKLHILKHHLNNKLPEQYTICCH